MIHTNNDTDTPQTFILILIQILVSVSVWRDFLLSLPPIQCSCCQNLDLCEKDKIAHLGFRLKGRHLMLPSITSNLIPLLYIFLSCKVKEIWYGLLKIQPFVQISIYIYLISVLKLLFYNENEICNYCKVCKIVK